MTIPVLLLAMLLGDGTSGLQSTASPTVVFVCEHGAAKSLIASAYFNKLAAERGLSVRATFRAVTPQEDLSVRTVAGLKADGLPIPDQKPSAVSSVDVEHATHIFAIGCQLANAVSQSGKAARWDDVPDDQGYSAMRDAIVTHVKALLDQIQSRK